MKQAQLVNVLKAYGNTNSESQRGRMKGQATFALFLASYVERLVIPADQEYDFWDIDNHIPRIIVGAVRAFEKSEEPWIAEFRKAYEKETEHPFYDPTRVYAGNNVGEVLEVEMIKEIIYGIMGPRGVYLRNDVDALLNAERHVVALRFSQFEDQVYYVGGLSKKIAKCRFKGMSGQFGDTTLRSYAIAAILMLTFSRGSGENEDSVSFVCEEDDLIGLNGGLQSCYAELPIALAMIEDVITNWPTSKSCFKTDKKVAIG
jgi:hypothetical protein